jgi:DNA-binding response OmpR family regulator
MKPGRILLVEDERIIAMDVKARLEARGYEVCEMVAAGEDAIRAARMSRPDIVLMDIFLEGDMDGTEAAARIRSELGTPVIFLSAFTDPETLRRAMEADPFGYFIKPFDEKSVHLGIEVALRRHAFEGKLRRNHNGGGAASK